MNKIQKCECPPETPSYVDEDGLIICNIRKEADAIILIFLKVCDLILRFF